MTSILDTLRRSTAFATISILTCLLTVPSTWAAHDPGRIVSGAELAAVHGGTCDAACNGGTRDDPAPVGSAYWEVDSQTLVSLDRGVAVVVHTLENYAPSPTTYSFEYADRIVRRVDIGGSFGRFFTASIGGEIDRTVTRTMQKTLNPFEGLVVSSWLETRRYRVEGTRYQDYDDGTRHVVARDSGPFVTASTRTRLTTFDLR